MRMERPRMETAIMEEPQAVTDLTAEVTIGAPQATSGVYVAPTVGDVLKGFFTRPVETLLRRWNWKSAFLSSLFRASIFFFTNLAAGWHAALGALLAELILRGATSGFYGAITESFSEAR